MFSATLFFCRKYPVFTLLLVIIIKRYTFLCCFFVFFNCQQYTSISPAEAFNFNLTLYFSGKKDSWQHFNFFFLSSLVVLAFCYLINHENSVNSTFVSPTLQRNIFFSMEKFSRSGAFSIPLCRVWESSSVLK